MTGPEFALWVAAMRARGLARTKTECGHLLGRSDQWVTKALKKGTDYTTALACAAVLAGIEPFTADYVKPSVPQSGGPDRP